jgi:predicted RNase H-like HicB family nuclease
MSSEGIEARRSEQLVPLLHTRLAEACALLDRAEERVLAEEGLMAGVQPGQEALLQRFQIETEREEDGGWIAEVVDLPGVMVYGEDRAIALAKVQALARRVLADRLEHGAGIAEPVSVSFEIA